MQRGEKGDGLQHEESKLNLPPVSPNLTLGMSWRAGGVTWQV